MDYVDVFEQSNNAVPFVVESLPDNYNRQIFSDKFKFREREILTASLELLPPDLVKSISKNSPLTK